MVRRSHAFSRLIDKDPKNALAWAVRGKIYLAQQDVPNTPSRI